MEKINDFEFKSNGITIVFERTEPTGGETVPKYSFAVKGDEELTNQLLSSTRVKKVKFHDIFFCAVGIFKKIEGKFVDSKPAHGKIIISSSVAQKGPSGDKYLKVNLIHQRGTLTKTFNLYGAGTFGTLGDWKDIFYSRQEEQYAKFLAQFGLELPQELVEMGNVDERKLESALDKFSAMFIFR